MNARMPSVVVLAALAACSARAASPGEGAAPPPTRPAAAEPPAAPPSKDRASDRARERMHDPSTIVRCAGEYWVFSTGTGIQSWRSKDLIAWTPGPRVFAAAPAWVREFLPGHRGHFWAPDVILLDGRYLLYYSVSTWGKNTSAIALAVTPALDPADPRFGWKDAGIVIRSSPADDFNAIDPSVVLDADNRLWLAFGSFWSGIKLVELDRASGLRAAPGGPVHALAAHREIEAPCIVARGGEYYLFVNWGLCCRGVRSTYVIVVGRSPDITGPYLDRAGRDLRDDGGSLFLDRADRFIGPGHAGVLQAQGSTYLSYHFYDASRDGLPSLAVRTLSWDADGWPVAGPMISPPAATPAAPAAPENPAPTSGRSSEDPRP